MVRSFFPFVKCHGLVLLRTAVLTERPRVRRAHSSRTFFYLGPLEMGIGTSVWDASHPSTWCLTGSLVIRNYNALFVLFNCYCNTRLYAVTILFTLLGSHLVLSEAHFWHLILADLSEVWPAWPLTSQIVQQLRLHPYALLHPEHTFSLLNYDRVPSKDVPCTLSNRTDCFPWYQMQSNNVHALFWGAFLNGSAQFGNKLKFCLLYL